MLLVLASVAACFAGVRAQGRPEIALAPAPECETIKGQRCVFPFTYRGKTYNECTHDGTTNGSPWCAYEVQRNGNAVPGKWEDCDTSLCTVDKPACLTESGPDTGNACQFPFKFNGVTYFSCARWTWQGTNHGKYWCSTKTDRNGNHVNGQGNYGFCGFCDNSACGCNTCNNAGFGGDQRIAFAAEAPPVPAARGGSSPN